MYMRVLTDSYHVPLQQQVQYCVLGLYVQAPLCAVVRAQLGAWPLLVDVSAHSKQQQCQYYNVSVLTQAINIAVEPKLSNRIHKGGATSNMANRICSAGHYDNPLVQLAATLFVHEQ
jgi:hypothetical protein